MILMSGPDLSKVPRGKLEKIAKLKKITLEPNERINSLRMKLYENVEQNELQKLAGDYIYAGRTSSVYYKYTPIDGKTQQNIKRDNSSFIER